MVERIAERMDFQFAAVAGAGIDLADRQAAGRAFAAPRALRPPRSACGGAGSGSGVGVQAANPATPWGK
jgi:hypothetical protein